jgi:hypothetical protein
MNTKEWLNRGWHLDKEIKALQQAKQMALDKATNVSSIIDPNKVQCSKGNSTEDNLIRYTDYVLIIDKRIGELCFILNEILIAINKVEDNKQRILLIERYVNFQNWEFIKEFLEYTDTSNVFRLHNIALKKIKII